MYIRTVQHKYYGTIISTFIDIIITITVILCTINN